MGPSSHSLLWSLLGEDLITHGADIRTVQKYIREILSLGFEAQNENFKVSIEPKDMIGVSFSENHITIRTDDLEVSFDLMSNKELENFVVKA